MDFVRIVFIDPFEGREEGWEPQGRQEIDGNFHLMDAGSFITKKKQILMIFAKWITEMIKVLILWSILYLPGAIKL